MSVVQEVIRPKPLPTPASTPCNPNTPGKQAPTLLPSQYITQEEPSRNNQVPPPLVSQYIVYKEDFDYDNSTDQYESISEGHHDESSPTTQQELE
jgi:hypothetical protein